MPTNCLLAVQRVKTYGQNDPKCLRTWNCNCSWYPVQCNATLNSYLAVQQFSEYVCRRKTMPNAWKGPETSIEIDFRLIRLFRLNTPKNHRLAFNWMVGMDIPENNFNALKIPKTSIEVYSFVPIGYTAKPPVGGLSMFRYRRKQCQRSEKKTETSIYWFLNNFCISLIHS